MQLARRIRALEKAKTRGQPDGPCPACGAVPGNPGGTIFRMQGENEPPPPPPCRVCGSGVYRIEFDREG